jgi:transposase
MKQYSEAFIGFDAAKNKHAAAIADVGREGEIRYLGEIDSSPAAVERMIGKLAGIRSRSNCPSAPNPSRRARDGVSCCVVRRSLINQKRPRAPRVSLQYRQAVPYASSDREARADCQGGELIDRTAARARRGRAGRNRRPSCSGSGGRPRTSTR